MRKEDFFQRLKDLVRLEESEENEEIREEFLHLTPEERQFRGKALLGLFLEEKHYSPAGHYLSTFMFSDRREFPLFTLQEGDIVSIFPEGVKPDEIPSGTVYERTKTSITVAMGEVWPDWFTDETAYQLHRSTNRVTYRRMLEALDAVMQTQNTRLAALRDISLGERKAATKKDAASAIEWLNPFLNHSQKEAVKSALCAEDVMLLHGPPGTGKTTALIEIIRQHLERKKTVFVTAPSNTACDNILERLIERGVNALRLGHPARISTDLREHTLDFKLVLHPVARVIVEKEKELSRLFKKQERYRERRSPGFDAEKELKQEISFLKQEIKNARKEVFERVMKETEVVVATPSGVQDRSIREKEFDVVVIDEATQATEPISWIPTTRAKKLIMAGDHFQLPPTVRSVEAEKQGLGVTLFERLHKVLGEESKVLLRQQYRMNEKIMNFSSREFYGGLLEADALVKDHLLCQLPGVTDAEETREAFLYIDTAGKGFEEKLEPGSESRYNPEEAHLVLSILQKMLSLGVPASEIAVISPYSAQVRFLADKSPDPRVEIDSVDGFQGREKELVIVSLVRSNLTGEIGFLGDTRRMNVALTRARRKLIAIGDSATLSSIAFYRDFIKYAEEIGAHRSAWEYEAS